MAVEVRFRNPFGVSDRAQRGRMHLRISARCREARERATGVGVPPFILCSLVRCWVVKLKHVGLGVIHRGSEFGALGRAGPRRAATARGPARHHLRRGCCDEGRDDMPAAPASMRQDVAHEVDAAALPTGGEDL